MARVLRTAEVVHIDLGIAFEAGRFLSTPERVPFRMTRDIVDGFGVTGGRCRLAQSVPQPQETRASGWRSSVHVHRQGADLALHSPVRICPACCGHSQGDHAAWLPAAGAC